MTEKTQQPISRLMRSDLWILAMLGALGILLFLAKFNESFPSASIDLSIPKKQIVEEAKRWSNQMGYNPDGAITSTVFSYDDDGKTFLEHELGQAKANELMRKEIPTWFWRTRFCRPFKQEQINIAISTDGRLQFVDRSIPNDVKLPSITHPEARKMAEEFVQSKIGISLKDTELIDDAATKQVGRTDHYFTWKHLHPDYKDGMLYTYVYISGNQLTQYNHYLHVPQRFEHQYAKMRAWNETLKSIANIIFVALAASIAFIFIWAFAQGRIRWRLVIIAAIITAVFEILGWFDNWPTLMSGYDTSTSVDQYVTKSLIRLLASTAMSMLQSMVFVGAVEPIYRLMFPKKIAIEKLLTPSGLRSRSVFQGLVAGLAVFGIHTAYVVAFYLLGQRLGFWDPLDIRDAANLSHLSPVFDAINVGLFASTMEEMMYRVLCLAIFQRLTKNFWVANLLQAASWAFMHSDYPQEPPYVRGVELTIGGTFYGWVLRRFGLLATVLAHYTYDAFLGVTPLVSSASVTDRMTSVVAILPGILALIISAVLMRTKGPIEDETPLENDQIPISAKPPHAQAIEPDENEAPYVPLSKKMRIAIVASTIVLLIFASALKPRVLGFNNLITINREQATNLAREYLLKGGINTTGMQHVAWLRDQTDDGALQYVVEKEGFRRARQLEQGIEPRLAYRVRFFRELSPTEYYVVLSGTGQVLAQYILKDEDARGDKLSAADAEKRVDQFLRKYHPRIFPLELDKEPISHDYKARRDYDMTYTAPQFKAGTADFKVDLSVVGGDVSGYAAGWRVPDEWTFERERKSAANQKLSFLLKNTIGGLFGLLLLWLIWDVLRSHAIRWKPAIVFGAIFAAASLSSALNSWPLVCSKYSTDEAFNTFFTVQIGDTAVRLLLAVALGGLCAAFGYGAFRRAFPNYSLASLLRPILPTGLGGVGSNRQLWLDALIGGVGFIFSRLALDKIVDVISSMVSPAVRVYSLSTQADFTDEASIWVRVITLALMGAALFPLVAAVISAVSVRLLRGKFLWIMVAVVAVVATLGSSEFYREDWLMQVVEAIVLTPFVYFYITRVTRMNLLAYAIAGWFFMILPQLFALLRSAPNVFFGDIAVLIVALAAPLAYTFWLYAFAPKPVFKP